MGTCRKKILVSGLLLLFIYHGSIFIEGKYILAEKKILHPFSSKHEEFIPPQYVNIDLGGFSLYTGVKFIF